MHRRILRGYLFACIATMVTLYVHLFFLQGGLGNAAPFAWFYVAVTATAWYGGLKPGLLATLLSVLVVNYLYFPPPHTFNPLFLSDKVKITKLVIFVIEGIIMSLLCDRLFVVRRALEEKTKSLQREAEKRGKLAEALKKSEQEFRAIYELAAVGIVQVDLLMGRFFRVNQKFCDMVGYTKEELIGRTFMEITHPEDRERNFAELLLFREGKIKNYVTEKRYMHKKGYPVWVELHVTMLCDMSGHPIRTIGIAMDIHSRKEAEEALKLADRKKDEFIATLAHELRNPLAAISNSIQLLSMKEKTPISVDLTPILEQQVNYMVHLIDDLMDIASISQGKIVLNRENLTLANIIAAAVETTRSLFNSKSQQLTIHVPPSEIICVNGDLVRLTQIFTNLLTNASKYTEQNGSISIIVEPEGQEVAIVVRDNGIGIQSDMLPHIFEMFTQANHQMGCYNQGLGIGLALTRNLVALHGGVIEAYSEGLGKGSEFTVRLPVITDRVVKAKPRVKEGHSVSGRSHRVLIVDDNDASARTIGWMMENLGHEYNIASNGKDAVERARVFHPDIILLDVGMPDMDGYEVCKKIRNEPSLKDVVIVAQTGWGGGEHRERSKEAGFNYFLIKPIDMNALKQIFENEHLLAYGFTSNAH